MTVPTIDISRYVNGLLSDDELAVLAAACEDHGFFFICGHGKQALLDAVFEQSRRFFALPRSEKMKIFRDEVNPLGYFDRELTKQKRDQKEVFDFKAGGYISSDPARRTRWPDHDARFREVLTRFFVEFTTLSATTMSMVFTSLGMPAARIGRTMSEAFGDHHSSAARLNYYPPADPLPRTEQAGVNDLGDMALHHHTDPGAITLLMQDDHGGLQARSRRHGWIDVPPQPGSIVVNIGDVLQVWSNDRCTAGMHRVLPVSSSAGRYSTPFFYQPRYDAVIEPWVAPGDQAHFEAFSWRDYIRGRVTDNYRDDGVDDIQIERFRVA